MFTDELVGNGASDPADYAVTHKLDAAPDGVFEEPTPLVGTATDLLAAVHSAVATDNRRKGQLGKHSPLEREGKYANLQSGTSLIKPGDVLPGFGPVTYTNMVQAKFHALELEKERQLRRS